MTRKAKKRRGPGGTGGDRAPAEKKRGRSGGPGKATPKRLENAALHYLARYATSAANLGRVLMRKVERSARVHGTDRDEGRVHVDGLVRRFVLSGLVDDAAYARAKAASLARRGASARLIQARLAEKGVDREAIAAALSALSENGADPDFRAAVNLARRRRLGPFRKGKRNPAAPERKKERDKALATMARAGFSYAVASRVIDAASAEELEDAAGRKGVYP